MRGINMWNELLHHMGTHEAESKGIARVSVSAKHVHELNTKGHALVEE
jgi:hypothetical protein